MSKQVFELEEFNFESCLTDDSANYREVEFKNQKTGEILASFKLKPISYGELMDATGPDAKENVIKTLSASIVSYWFKGQSMESPTGKLTEEEINNLMPAIVNGLIAEAGKLIYVSKNEEKN